jgi:hypothetical protein
MNLVAAISQFQSQLRGDHTAATVGWITCDSDFHDERISSVGRIAFYRRPLRAANAKLINQGLDGFPGAGIQARVRATKALRS